MRRSGGARPRGGRGSLDGGASEHRRRRRVRRTPSPRTHHPGEATSRGARRGTRRPPRQLRDGARRHHRATRVSPAPTVARGAMPQRHGRPAVRSCRWPDRGHRPEPAPRSEPDLTRPKGVGGGPLREPRGDREGLRLFGRSIRPTRFPVGGRRCLRPPRSPRPSMRGRRRHVRARSCRSRVLAGPNPHLRVRPPGARAPRSRGPAGR